MVFRDICKTECFITESAVKNSAAKWIPENCVIVAISGATAGRCAINKIPLTTNQHCLNLEVDPEMALYRYVSEQREKELAKIIQEEKLKEPETRKYLANAFRDGEIKTVGTDIDKLMPPVSRFGGGGRAQKKQGVIDKLKSFFDKFFGIGGSSMAEDDSK